MTSDRDDRIFLLRAVLIALCMLVAGATAAALVVKFLESTVW